MKQHASTRTKLPCHADYYGPAIVPDVIAKLASTWRPGSLQVIPPSFGIHLASTEAGRHSAAALVNKMYNWRGYGEQHLPEANPYHVTLTASGSHQILGTVTLRTDTPAGMLMDATFKEVIDTYRQGGAKVCEVTKLAIDPLAHPKLALASLVHIVYLYASKIHACTDMFIEVNPRHKRFYEQMLGFEEAADMRTNARVNAPAHLLRISLDFMGAQIARMGGTGAPTGRESRRSLYPYFFCGSTEASLISLLSSLSEFPSVYDSELRWA